MRIPLARAIALAAWALFETSASGQTSTKSVGPIIDVHVHSYTDADPRFAMKAPNPATGAPLSVANAAEHRRATLDALRRHGVVHALVSNGDDPLESVQAFANDAPGLVMPAAGFDRPTVDASWIRAQHKAGKLKVIGEIGAQYSGLTLNDPLFEPILAVAEELDIPIGVHTGLGPPGSTTRCCPKMRAALGNPALIEEVLVRHPKLRIYIMHAGWPYLQETKALMYLHPQLHADLSVINWILPREEFHAYLQALMRSGLGKRLMFGSDQMVWPDAIGLAIQGIDSAPFLSHDEKRDIFYGNAARFLRLDPASPPAPR